MTEVRVPTLGESVTEATVATWYKKAGDAVAVDEMLCELETDKVTVEVPSPAAGVLTEIVAPEGTTVGVDALLAQVGEAGAQAGAQRGAKTGASATAPQAGRGRARDAGAEDLPRPAAGAKGGAAGPAAAPHGQTDEGTTMDVMVPTLGESVSEATVSTWFKAVGDRVEQDEMLCELETDKVSVEVPSPAAGTLSEIVAAEGETVAANARLAVLSTGDAAAPKSIDAGPEAVVARDGNEAEPPTSVPETAADKGTRTDTGQDTGQDTGTDTDAPSRKGARADVEDAPSAKKAMAEAGIERDAVRGSGRDGRVMKADVARAASAGPTDASTGAPVAPGSRDAAPAAKAPAPPAAAEAPQPAPAPRGPVPADDAGREERVRMTRLRQTIARRLKDAQNTAAMLTTYNEVDMSAIMALRAEYKDLFERKHKVKLGFMSFFVKACCHALMEVPDVNAEIDGTDIVYKHYVHMGVAVGTPSGLVVPVVRDADAMGFAEIEKAIAALGAKARDGKLSMADMQGGSFTISNGGVYGSLMSSPILNPPQSGILGMHKIQDRPVAVDGAVVIRPMMYLALSYDHRVVDGKGAVTFLVRVKEALEDPRRLLMDL